MNRKVIGIAVVIIIIILAVIILGRSFFPSHNPFSQTSSSLPVNNQITSCTSSDLNEVASWQGATGSLVGAVQFTNKGTSACNITFNEAFSVKIIDSSGQVLETQQTDANECHKVNTVLVCPPSGAVLINPKKQISLPIEWSNWCQANPKTALSLKIMLSAGNEITVPLTGLSGAPLTDTPRCDNDNNPSVLSIKQFSTQ